MEIFPLVLKRFAESLAEEVTKAHGAATSDEQKGRSPARPAYLLKRGDPESAAP